MPKIRAGGPPQDNFDWAAYEYEGYSAKKGKRKGYVPEPGTQENTDLLRKAVRGFAPPKVGKIIEGTIIAVSPTHARVDIGWREEAIIDLKKENSDSVSEMVPGARMDVILESMDSNGSRAPKASHSRMVQSMVKDELMSNIGKRFAFSGVVESMIENAGYIVDISGVKCFMPGSLAGMNKIVDFSSLLGKEIYVVAINYSPERDCVVVSHREFLKTLVPVELSKIKEGDFLSGFVTGTSHHGVFIEFNGCLTGLVSKGDLLPETLARFDSIAPGEAFDFFVKEIIDTRIVLSEKPLQPSPWEAAEGMVGQVVKGRVKKVMHYGVFVEVLPKAVGLLHKSYLTDTDFFEEGMEVEVVVLRVDRAAKRIDLSV